MGEVIGNCVAEGLDSDTGKAYTETFEVRKIKGISEELMIAVGNEDGFYVYAADEEAVPDTLSKLLELYELSQNLELNYATKCEGYEEKEELLLDNDEKIWRILYGCGDAKLDDTIDFFERENRRCLAFTATSEALGVYNRVIYISEDGYFATNIFDYEYSYFIGKEATGQIISYVQKHSTETKSSTSLPTISGTVTEIGNGYIMVDDTVLCKKSKAGKKYKVYTDDIKIRRWIESGELKERNWKLYEKHSIRTIERKCLKMPDPCDIIVAYVSNLLKGVPQCVKDKSSCTVLMIFTSRSRFCVSGCVLLSLFSLYVCLRVWCTI